MAIRDAVSMLGNLASINSTECVHMLLIVIEL